MATIALIKEAILALKDRTGSSVPAITKWIETEKKAPVPAKHVMKAALKKGVADGTLVQVKNSYKVSAEAKKAMKPKKPKKKAAPKKKKAAPKKKKTAAKKKTTKKKAAPKKKTAPKKKKTTTKKK